MNDHMQKQMPYYRWVENWSYFVWAETLKIIIRLIEKKLRLQRINFLPVQTFMTTQIEFQNLYKNLNLEITYTRLNLQ